MTPTNTAAAMIGHFDPDLAESDINARTSTHREMKETPPIRKVPARRARALRLTVFATSVSSMWMKGEARPDDRPEILSLSAACLAEAVEYDVAAVTVRDDDVSALRVLLQAFSKE